MVNLGPTGPDLCFGYWPDAGTPCHRMLVDGVCPKAAHPDHGYRITQDVPTDGSPGDPRWDWCNIQTLSDPGPVWIKGQCKHLTPEPVEVTDPVTDEVILVARLCPDCDTQLETDWTRDQLPAPNGFERWAYAPDHPAGARETARLALKDDHLVYVNGPAINKRTPVRPPWYVLAARWYWKGYLEIWEGQKKAVHVFLNSFGYMWPLYLVGLDYLLGGISK